MTAVIDVDGVCKTFRRRGRRRAALDGLSLQVEAGQVHGLLGPDGSGKTTALRIMLGLARADHGTVRLLGHRSPDELARVAGRVGAVLDRPRFPGTVTGRRTLRLLAAAGGVPYAEVGRVLDRVGLAAHADDAVGTFSPGMARRLAVAAALLPSPDLLILDEPTAGLDVAGIRWLRDLLGGLAADGVTALVASHRLTDAERLCDTVTVVSGGRRVTAGPVSEVLAAYDRGEFRVRVSDQDRAIAIIAETGLPVTPYDDHFVVGDLADASWLSRTLARHGLWVSELTPLTPDLADVLLALTGATADEPAAPPEPAAPEGRS